LSKKTFEIVDLAILSLIACVFESVTLWAFNHFTAMFYISFACVLGMIAIFRWNWAGLIVAPLAGMASLMTRAILGMSVSLTLGLTYSVGYLGLAVCLLFFLKKNKEKMQGNYGAMALYYLAGYFAVELFRALLQIPTGELFHSLGLYLLLDLVNILLGLAILFFAIHQKTLVVDMNQYLHRLAMEKTVNGLSMTAKEAVRMEEMANNDDLNDASLLDGGTLSDDDLAALQRDRRRMEGTSSRFDKEQMAQERRKSP